MSDWNFCPQLTAISSRPRNTLTLTYLTDWRPSLQSRPIRSALFLSLRALFLGSMDVFTYGGATDINGHFPSFFPQTSQIEQQKDRNAHSQKSKQCSRNNRLPIKHESSNWAYELPTAT